MQQTKLESAMDMNYESIKAYETRPGWGAPRRHVAITPKVEGPWGERLELLVKLLGSGFMDVLIGGRGTGKTQLAVEVMKRATANGSTARFVTATEFFIRVKSSYRKDADMSEEDVLKALRSPSLLVIDEIGRRGESAWENNLLFELLNKRYNDVTDTLMICNLSPAELAESIGPSLMDRMRETGGIINCNWPSFR